MLYGRAKESIRMLPAAFLQKIAISFLISQISNCILAFYALTMSGALSQLLVCQTYVTPYLMKSWSVSFGDFHPSGRIGKQL